MRAFFERFRFRRWGKWLLLAGVGIVLLSTIGVEATSRSSFCDTCHIMEPYYTSWKHSTHANVECVACHIAPGMNNFVAAKLNGLGQVVDDVLSRTSTKPSATVSQFSCLRSGCHSMEKLGKHMLNNGSFKFDHAKHLGQKHLGVEISCTICHSHVKGDEHFEVNTNVCITCHMLNGATGTVAHVGGRETTEIHLAVRTNGHLPEDHAEREARGEKIPPASCATCHDPPKGEIEYQGLKIDHSRFLAFGATCESCHQGVTATPPPIDDGRCLECHTFGVERAGDSREMHRTHTLGRHKVECSSCHGTMRHGPQVQTASLEKFDCNRCHVDQHMVQRRTYFHVGDEASGAGDGDPISPMFLAHVDCTGCHTRRREISVKPDSGASVMAADAAACNRCHQEGLGEKMIPLWQKTTRALYEQVEQGIREAEAGGADTAALERARELLVLVRTDGSWGVHNPRYTQALLERARDALAEARARKETAP